MKAAALALVLVVSAVQTVGWVDCCCVLICKHQNKTCGECEEKAQASAPESCCDTAKAPAKEQRDHQKDESCAHVQPSSEVASHADPLPPVVFDVVLELPVVPFAPSPEVFEKASSLFSQVRGSPPLHILNSVLLI